MDQQLSEKPDKMQQLKFYFEVYKHHFDLFIKAGCPE